MCPSLPAAQVAAGPALAAALLHGPLLVHVHKQPAAAEPSVAPAAGASRSAVLVGTAELDLSALLWASSGAGSAAASAQQQLRSVAGSYPLLEGAAASQGGASLTAHVQLQLTPAARAAEQAAAAAASGVDAKAATAWELGGGADSNSNAGQQPTACWAAAPQAPQAPQAERQPEQQGMHPPQQPCYLSSSDDEGNEELLRRCGRLVDAAPAAPASPPGPLLAHSTSCSGQGVQAAGGGGGAGDPPQQQQQQQQAAGGAAFAAGASQHQLQQEATSSPDSSGSPVLQQAERPPAPPGDDDEQGGRLLVCIDTALRLPSALPATSSSHGGDSGYSVHVQVAWSGRPQPQLRTPAVPVHVVEAAGLGGTAAWNAELELPAAAAAWAAPASSSGGGGGSSPAGPALLLNVWATPGTPGASGRASGQPGGAADSLLGCAVLGLSALPGAAQLAGWWRIVDSQQRQQGELKASVRPSAALLSQLRALAPAPAPVEPAAASAAPQPSSSAPASPAAASSAQEPAAAQDGAAGEPAAEEPAGDLTEQVAVQLQGLQLLSQRLAAEPPGAAAAAAASAEPAEVTAPAAGASPAAAAAGAGSAVAEAAVHKLYDELPASDDEALLDLAPFDARQVRACAAALLYAHACSVLGVCQPLPLLL